MSRIAEEVRRLVPELSSLSGEVWLVGGAVRDLLLGREPNDFDLACLPGQAAAVAAELARGTRGRLVDLGRDRFSTVRIVTPKGEFDLTDLQGTLEEDLARRDATINAMAFSIRDAQLIDLFEGQTDLAQRRLRMVRETNFADDPLRVLKLVRMAVELDFELEAATFEAMERHAAEISRVAAERIDAELTLIVDSERAPIGISLLSALGLGSILFGRKISDAALGGLQHSEVPGVSRWGLLCADLPDVELAALAQRAKWPGERLRSLLSLRRLIERAEAPDRELLLSLHDEGSQSAQAAIAYLKALGRGERAARLEQMLTRYGQRLFSSRTLLSGHEIAALAGIDPGPAVGSWKRRLLEAEILGEVTTREEAIRLITETN